MPDHPGGTARGGRGNPPAFVLPKRQDMTEKEKAAAGLPYDPNHDSELQDLMHQAACKLFEFNNTPPAKRDERQHILNQLLGSLGEGSIILPPFHCDYGSNITIGRNTFANTNLTILDGARVTIGDNVFIAPNVGIYTAGHPLDVATRNKGIEYARPVTIGDNVWIGAGTSILPGVTIGEGCVIGAGSVVNRSIPPGTLAVGNPCRVVREIDQDGNHG